MRGGQGVGIGSASGSAPPFPASDHVHGAPVGMRPSLGGCKSILKLVWLFLARISAIGLNFPAYSGCFAPSPPDSWCFPFSSLYLADTCPKGCLNESRRPVFMLTPLLPSFCVAICDFNFGYSHFSTEPSSSLLRLCVCKTYSSA